MLMNNKKTYQFLYMIVDKNKTVKNRKKLMDSNWIITSHMTETEMSDLAQHILKIYIKFNMYIEYQKLAINPTRLTRIKIIENVRKNENNNDNR